MNITEKITVPLIESRYLSAENADRYRSIMRLFYLYYEKMRYWLYQEEIFEELKAEPYFADYTMEQCRQDLNALVGWRNLSTLQDTRNVKSIEAFKNKNFRYQMTEYSVEIERMVVRLENLFVEGASLEPALLDRLRIQIGKLEETAALESDQVHVWWNDLNHDFMRLNQNYQDYMRELNSVRAEELMRTQEFLVFKDRLIDYLRSFVQSLQMNVGKIEQHLKKADPQIVAKLLDKVTQFELSVPRMDVEVKEEQIRERMEGRFQSIRSWFVGGAGEESEAAKVFDTTNEIIRKITRYAARISEAGNRGANRREEYQKLASLFAKCRDIREAHCLSAMVFGIEKPVHLKGDFKRETDSINSGVYEEEPLRVTIAPRVRNYKEKAKRSVIADRSKEKHEARDAVLQRERKNRDLLQEYIKDGRLIFAELPVLEPYVRDVFLLWLSKALENKSRTAKTEDGRYYTVEEREPGKRCVLQCTDGTFSMPVFTIIFEE